MRILLLQLDGKLPNIALMRIAAHYAGEEVVLRRGGERNLWDQPWDKVYASAIFEKTRPAVDRVLREHPDAIIGGTGVDLRVSLEDYGITTKRQDYSIYPDFHESIGFSQRGCRLKCEFCVVPRKEGSVQEYGTIADIWRGDPWPKDIHLLDNDFFGQSHWRERIAEMREGKFRISFSQGINARCITDEAAEAIASVDYRSTNMKERRLYTAWDNRKDEAALFAGLSRLVKYGVKPGQITVYILVGFWPGETSADRDYRRAKLRDFGCDPFPMPFVRTPELMGFQRWIIGAYDKPSKQHPDGIPWREWSDAKWRPENIRPEPVFPLFQEA